MNKICGYNCEHNKGGRCQITYCDKIGKMTTTTQEPEVLTRWQDPTIYEKDKEIERLNNIIDKLEKWLEDYIKLFNQPDMLEEQTLEDLKEVLDKLKELKEGKE